MKGRKSKILYLNPDPFQCYIGPKNWNEVLIDSELTTCLLDNGSHFNFFLLLLMPSREASMSCPLTTSLRSLVEPCHQLTASEEASSNLLGL